jgi:drug/metabolite transporter (DMT)-like permease
LKASGRFVSYGRKAGWSLALSGMLPALHWVFFYASIKYSNVSVGVICFCLTAFFTAVLSPFIKKKRFSPIELVLSLLTVAGVGLIFHFDTHFRVGIVMGVFCALFGALYIMNNERLVKMYDVYMISCFQMLGATVGVGVMLVVYCFISPGVRWMPQGVEIGYLVVLALFCTVGLYVMVGKVLRRLPAFTVNLSFNLEPVYSIVLAMILFKENKVLNGGFYVGVGMILLSVVMQGVVAFRRRG